MNIWRHICRWIFPFLLGVTCTAAGWQDDPKPVVSVQLDGSNVHRFSGSSADSYQLVLSEGDYLLVGARDAVHNLSLPTLTAVNKIEWPAVDEHVNLCLLKGRSEEECRNYIRVLARKGPNQLLVCGTHAYKPMCREYTFEDGKYTHGKTHGGQGLSPYDPAHNSTAVLVDGELFVGTVADFSGMDPLIYRDPLRTEQYDATHLNAPNFVSSFAHGDHVYFTFRETAVEYMNCGKATYSRIARVCKNDRGGPHKFRNRWTSFFKARLNCSVPGEYPFYFNELQSTAGPYETRLNGKRADVIYATFTTPQNSIAGSAVCAFFLHDVERVFDGPFKEQAAVNYNWLPVSSHKVPEARPGVCTNDSQALPENTLNFLKTHSLMDESVPAVMNQPLVIRTGFSHRFTKIEVDPQVKTPDGKYYDVLFIGTDNGKVLKALRTDSTTLIIEEIQVFSPPKPVINLLIHAGKGDSSESRLIVVSQSEVVSMHLYRCYSDRAVSCAECVNLRDPYCAWDKRKEKCVFAGGWALSSNLFQNVLNGVHESCPEAKSSGKWPAGKDSSRRVMGADDRPVTSTASPVQNADLLGRDVRPADYETEREPEADDEDDIHVVIGESRPLYTAETLCIAVIAGALAALFLGFVLGYCCGRKCRKMNENVVTYPDADYEYFDQRHNYPTRRVSRDPKFVQPEEATYAEPMLVHPITMSNISPRATLHRAPSNAQSIPLYETDLGPYSTTPMLGEPFRNNPLNYGDHFATLRSNRTPMADGFGTTRSVKKVYL